MRIVQDKQDCPRSPPTKSGFARSPLVQSGISWHEKRMSSHAFPDLPTLRDAILESALPSVPFDGWTRETLRAAARRAGYPASMADAAFPNGVSGALDHFSDLADRKMLIALGDVCIESMKVRDRIRLALMTRLNELAPHREAVRLSLASCTFSPRGIGLRALWRTADRIWTWAGDVSTDYNHYTKRSLLAGVLLSTMLVWTGDTGPDSARTQTFLDRRIENVMQLGKFIGKFRKATAPAQETTT